jgi:hypothetical protein
VRSWDCRHCDDVTLRGALPVTKIQRHVLKIVAWHHLRNLWYRAATSGERVTLASLYRAGALTRRAWRGNEGEADAAHEYRLASVAEQALKQTLSSGDP